MKYPEVGEKFYYKDLYGELQERTCVRIIKEPNIERQYFTTWDEHGGLFVNESSILDPEDEEVKKLIAEKEKEEWRKFWTVERFNEILRFLIRTYSCDTGYSLWALGDFIKSKTK